MHREVLLFDAQCFAAQRAWNGIDCHRLPPWTLRPAAQRAASRFATSSAVMRFAVAQSPSTANQVDILNLEFNRGPDAAE